MNLCVSPPAQTSPVISFSIDETTIKRLVGCSFLEVIFEPDYVALSSQSKASSSPHTIIYHTRHSKMSYKSLVPGRWWHHMQIHDKSFTDVWRMLPNWRKFSHWMLLTQLVTHQLLWRVAGQSPTKCPCYFPAHVRNDKYSGETYLFGYNIFSLFPHFALPEQQETSLLMSCLEDGAHKFYLMVGCSDCTTSTGFTGTKETHKNTQRDIHTQNTNHSHRWKHLTLTILNTCKTKMFQYISISASW